MSLHPAGTPRGGAGPRRRARGRLRAAGVLALLATALLAGTPARAQAGPSPPPSGLPAPTQAAAAAAAPNPPPAGAAAAVELLCNLRTGEETRTLRVSPSPDALAAATATVADRFALRATLQSPADAPGQPAVAVVSVIDLESAGPPQPLAQGRWLLQGQAVLPADAPWAPLLTGWQRSYSPHLGRELAWGCAIVRAGATPAGWADADATLPLIVPPAAPGGATPRADAPRADTPRAAAPDAPATRPAAGSTVRLAWMGDVMLADGPGRIVARGGDPFAGVAGLLRQADLRIANLECVIATSGRAVDKPWTFRAHPRTLAVLKRHVDAVSLANNHSGDYGLQAFAEMLGRLERAGLPAFGGGGDLRAAHRPLILQRNGLRIALLAYNEMFPRAFEAGEQTPGIAWAEDEKIAAAIRAARAQADVVIPFLHWGQEHSPTAHARQRALARLMIRAGADAVVGTHPHVRQDTELIDGRPVIYSLGNFVFDGFSDADNNTGSILWMTVDRQGVVDWGLQAVTIDKQGRPTPSGR